MAKSRTATDEIDPSDELTAGEFDDVEGPKYRMLDDEEEEKKKRRKKKKSDTVDVTGQDGKIQSRSTTESAQSKDTVESGDAAEQKIIDVRV